LMERKGHEARGGMGFCGTTRSYTSPPRRGVSAELFPNQNGTGVVSIGEER
jgi:hypothetical protein